MRSVIIHVGNNNECTIMLVVFKKKKKIIQTINLKQNYFAIKIFFKRLSSSGVQ